MSVPGNAEPGAFSGQQQVQQQLSISFSSAIPIKKRKFPIIRPPSPSPEENPTGFEANSSENKQESGVQGEGLSLSDARNTVFPANSDASKTNTLIVKKEEVTPTNIELGQANMDVLASMHQEAIPSVGLGPADDLSDKMDMLSSDKSLESKVPESCMGAQTSGVKQEIVSGQSEDTRELNLSAGLMNVELSLGPKEPVASPLENQDVEANCHKSDISDPSLLSLALTEEKIVMHDNPDSTIHNISSRVTANRSNWDLNTTMDAWEGSVNSDAFAHRHADIGGLSNISNCHQEKSSLTTLGTVGLTMNKGKHMLDDHRGSSSTIASMQSTQQCKTDDALGLRLAMPFAGLDVSGQCSSLPDNLIPTSVSPNLIMQQVRLLAMNVKRTVKSEPVDENSKRDCSIGSCSSSNMGSSKFSSVKREFVNNHIVETVLQSSISPEKSVEHRSIKSEVFQEDSEECRSEDAIRLPSVPRVMQHQESCASSSAQPMTLMPLNTFPSRLSTHSELTTSGDLPSESEHSILSEKLHDHNDLLDENIASMASKHVSQDDKQLSPCKGGNSTLVDADKCKLPRIDEDTLESCQDVGVAANGEESTDVSTKMLEKNSSSSDCESQENCAVDTSMDIGENRCNKEDEEYEDGEVREPLQHSAGDERIIEGKKTENLELVECESQNLQPFVLSADQHINSPDLDGKNAVKENHDECHSNKNKDSVNRSCEPNSEDNSLQKLSDKVLEVGIGEKRSTSVPADKQLDPSGRTDVGESSEKEVPCDAPANEIHIMGVEEGNEATGKIFKETCSAEKDSTLPKVEASLNGHDAAKDSNNAGNKSRIINLSRAAVVTSPSKTRPIPDRLLTSRSGKERYSDLDGEMQSRGNREEVYTGGSYKFAKDRVHDQSFRNSRPRFILGKGRISGRFGSIRSEWDSDHNFASDTYGPSDYRAIRRKHASSISDVDLECNGYGVPQNDTALGGNRRKSMNDDFPLLRRTSLRRFSPGDRDGPVTRGGMQMLRRIPRNMSPSRGTVEDGSDVIGLRHSDKFMRHPSDDIIDPVYSRQQAMYGDLDGQLLRGNRNFSTLPRKGYPRIRSKSPVSSRTRSPGPWSSPRRRSPNGLPELTQQRSPAHFRMERVRSPDRACFRDEIVARRRGSPSYVSRHPNDLREMDSGREHVHPRSANSNRRGSPARVFPRSARRADALDSREMGDDDEYSNGLLHSNKFHELRGDGSIDERRKFIERRGAPRSFRPSYSNDTDNFRFHLNDGPRPYRFCPDAEPEFVERSNMREREFDGRIKHQSLVVPRRIRNIEEQQDGNYRPVERVWHDDGFSDARGKRRRF